MRAELAERWSLDRSAIELGHVLGAPGMQHRGAGPHIPDGHGQVDDSVDRLHGGPPAIDAHPVVVGPPDLLSRVFEAGREQQRHQPDLEGALSGPGRVVGRTHRGEGRNGQDQRARRCPEGRDRRPVHRPDHVHSLSLGSGGQDHHGTGRRGSNLRVTTDPPLGSNRGLGRFSHGERRVPDLTGQGAVDGAPLSSIPHACFSSSLTSNDGRWPSRP